MFQGFCKDTSDFLWDLMFNNERSWFQENKERFEQVLNKPFRALAADTVDCLKLRHPELDFSLHISRIYRDARRLFGRGPFKDHMWFSVGYAIEGWHSGPMFWFEIGAADFSYGMGFYSATPEQMAQFRRNVDANPARFERLAKKIDKNPLFKITGEEYARPKGDHGPIINKWYNRKRLGIECSFDFDGSLLGEDLPRTLVDCYAELMPMYKYFLEFYHTDEEKERRK